MKEKEKTLLILAAGMGSRFGGLKQMTPFGPNGEFIIDYSVYDAVRCGFNRIVFVIKRENYKDFRNTIGKRIQEKMNSYNVIVTYAFQNITSTAILAKIPYEREKPLGTAHAVLCTKDVIKGQFLMINSDDFYGYQAFKDASDYMDKNARIGVVGFNIKNTLTENGSVKRGVCFQKDGYLSRIVESNIEVNNGKIIAKPLNSDQIYELTDTTKVSMNMIAFNSKIFSSLEGKFNEFLRTADLLKDEFLIPDFLTYKITEEEEKVNIINTNSVWCGVTYREDAPNLMKFIRDQIEKGIYPNNLWN